MTIIRLATAVDTPALLPLMEQLGYPADQEVFQQRFDRFIGNQGYGVAVAVLEGAIVGVIAWSKTPLFVSDKIRFHIESLIVDENYRGQGIGKKLITFVEGVATNTAPAIIDLISGIRRAKDGTHEFYKSLGYKNDGHMAKVYLKKEF